MENNRLAPKFTPPGRPIAPFCGLIPILGAILLVAICGISGSQSEDIRRISPREPLPAGRLAAAPGAAPVGLNKVFETGFVVFPADCNANPPMLFGGKLLAEMDRAAGIAVRRCLYASPTARDAVTVGIADFSFKASAEVKDLVYIRASIVALGKKTLSVRIVAEKEIRPVRQGEAPGRVVLAEGLFTFAAYDREKRTAVEHGLKLEE